MGIFEDLVRSMSPHAHSKPACLDGLAKLRLNLLRGRTKRDERVRLKIPLSASRLVFGASLPEHADSRVLPQGTCFLRTGPGDGVAIEGPVLVGRSPSYAVGDIRCLTAVALPDSCPASRLKDCLLFSCDGERPDSDKMSGGDLDGDEYFVVWEPRLLALSGSIREQPPADYSIPSATYLKATAPSTMTLEA
jgi:hypothetical protein